MTSGDHNMIGEYKYGQVKGSNDGAVYGKAENRVHKLSIAQQMNRWFRDTTKKKSVYNYSATSTLIALNYAISKFDSVAEYEAFYRYVCYYNLPIFKDGFFDLIELSSKSCLLYTSDAADE